MYCSALALCLASHTILDAACGRPLRRRRLRPLLPLPLLDLLAKAPLVNLQRKESKEGSEGSEAGIKEEEASSSSPSFQPEKGGGRRMKDEWRKPKLIPSNPQKRWEILLLLR